MTKIAWRRRRDMKLNHVAGKNRGSIILYALSTCLWCRKTKQLLDQLGVVYNYIDVDLLEGEEKAKATEDVKNLNPRCSFPTLAVDGQCIVGFDEQKIKEAIRS
jgi:glutaredoxin-like protein NrdH